jgi:hypothetical protein
MRVEELGVKSEYGSQEGVWESKRSMGVKKEYNGKSQSLMEQIIA